MYAEAPCEVQLSDSSSGVISPAPEHELSADSCKDLTTRTISCLVCNLHEA